MTPSEGRRDDIVWRPIPRPARRELSYAVDGHKQRADIHRNRESALEVSMDGPYRRPRQRFRRRSALANRTQAVVGARTLGLLW